MSSVNDIPKGWVEINLGKLGRVITGKTPSKNNPNDWGNDFDFITPSEIDNSSKYIFNTPRKLSQQGFDRFSRMILPTNSVIVTCIGSDMGKVVMNKSQALTNQQINSIAIGDDYNNDYVFYLLKNAYRVLRRNAEGSGSTMPILNKSSFESLAFIISKNIEEQKAIANILTAFDDKIENLQAQNKTLEQTAQTIFKEWFGKYQVGDELPDGWRVGKLGDYISDSIGGDYGKEEPQGDYEIETICLRGTDLPDMKMGVPEKAPVRFLKKSKIEKCKLINGDIVIEISGGTENQSTGRVAYINNQILGQSEYPLTCVNFCRILRPKNPDNSYFVYSLLEYLYNRRILFNWENGTTGIKNLNLKALLKVFELVLPDNDDLIKKFNSISKNSFVKIQTNNIQIQTLKKTRDTLLPKLMSGQLRVNEFKESRMECI